MSLMIYRHLSFAAAFFAALVMPRTVLGQPLQMSFTDSTGADSGGKVDVTGMTVNFDNTTGS